MEASLAPVTKALVRPTAAKDLAAIEIQERAPARVVGTARQLSEALPGAYPVATADLDRKAAPAPEVKLDGPRRVALLRGVIKAA